MTSEIFNVEKKNRFLSLNIFCGSKQFMKLLNLMSKDVTVLNQSDLIFLFVEVFVRIFYYHFYLVSLDFCFFLNKLQKVCLKENIF